MASVKLPQFYFLQLATFLDNRPLKNFPTVKDYRKIMRQGEEIQKNLGEYFTKYLELEEKIGQLTLPFQKEFLELSKEYRDVQNKEEKEMTELEKKQKKKFQKLSQDIQDRADSDLELKKAQDDFEEYKKAENDKEVELSFNNPEYVNAMKKEFDEKASEWMGWTKKGILAISEIIEKL